MCNLYTTKLSRDEVHGLLRHYKLADQPWSATFADEQAAMNTDGRVFPKYPAPVVVVRNGNLSMEQIK